MVTNNIIKMNSRKKFLIVIFVFSFLFLSIGQCRAEDTAKPVLNLKNAFTVPLGLVAGPNGAGYNTTQSQENIISLIITTVLSFVGVIFLVLAIYGGYMWMMARGNEQQVEKAKQIILNSVIGLAVVLASYAVSWFIINTLGGATLTTK
jgi:cbb3-type cytochrome oxidase subunit 3